MRDGQGYLYARPQPLDEVLATLRDQSSLSRLPS